MPPPDDLPGYLGSISPLLERYGYAAIAALIGVESFGVPAPGQTIMVVAAVYAGAGRLSIWGVAAVAFIAAVLGDNLGYWIGHTGGRRVLLRYGKYVFITPERLARAEKMFDRHGGKVVAVARFIDGLRQFNGVIAGTVGMPFWRFTVFNAIGAALWVGLWCSVGYFAGDNIGVIYGTIHRYRWPALILVVLAIGVYAVAHFYWLRRRSRQDEAG
jgi:membrane protein DedA with SNARE-associated domain